MKLGIALNCYDLGSGNDCSDLHGHLNFVLNGYDRGLDSIFVFEHHFSGYIVSPAPLLAISYLAGRLPDATFGTSVLVLPLHDVIRLAEQIAVLDNLTHGRCLFGFGAGRSEFEYQGLGVDKSSSRERFPSMMSRLVELLTANSPSGTPQIRPRPAHSPEQRFYVAGRPPLGAYPVKPMCNYVPGMSTRRGAIVFIPITLALTTHKARLLAVRATHADLVLRNDHYGVTPTHPTSEQLQSALSGQVVGSASAAAEQIRTISEQVAPEYLVFEFAFGGRDLYEAAETVDLFATEVLPHLSGTLDRG